MNDLQALQFWQNALIRYNIAIFNIDFTTNRNTLKIFFDEIAINNMDFGLCLYAEPLNSVKLDHWYLLEDYIKQNPYYNTESVGFIYQTPWRIYTDFINQQYLFEWVSLQLTKHKLRKAFLYRIITIEKLVYFYQKEVTK